MKEIKCPCCEKATVREYEICPVCNWENDPIQSRHPNIHGANKMTLPEAKEAYRQGKQVK